MRSLSGRLLAITIGIVLLVQLALLSAFLVSRWRDVLSEKLAGGLVAVFVQEAAGADGLSPQLKDKVLMVTGVHSIALKQESFRQLVMTDHTFTPIAARYDLRDETYIRCLMGAAKTLLSAGDERLQVVGPIQRLPGEFVEIVMSQSEIYGPLKSALITGLLTALGFAAAIGGALYFTVSRFLVAPVERLTRSMVNFASDPESPSNTLTAWNRYDEIGTAAKELRDLQVRLRNLLGEKRRLANLGSAVARINHDLRNLFATMQLVSDTLERVDDPRVQRAAPRLVRALERGIALCETTLEYGRVGAIDVKKTPQELAPIVNEALDQFDGQFAQIECQIKDGLQVDVDSDHLFRIISNLARNAKQAFDQNTAKEPTFTVSGSLSANMVRLLIKDNGPGIPDHIRRSLFDAFGASASKGGSGLGLAISKELAQAMDGDLHLLRSNENGTCFALDLPT